MKKFIHFIAAAGLLLSALLLGISLAIRHEVRKVYPFIIHDIGPLPPKRVAIVFGARVYADGTPSAMLNERVSAAVELYKHGKVKKLLMTGDHRTQNYNEPEAMKALAVGQGVLPADVGLDYAGFRTYDSLYRARDIFGVKEAILVTESYHLYRAIYIARTLGMDALGYPAERERYFGQTWRDLREVMATNMAWIDLHCLHRRPHFLGKLETL